MKELSFHILDIAMNSVRANCSELIIRISINSSDNLMQIVIKDDGHGIDPEGLKLISDPFYTSKAKKKIGLGIPLFKFTCEQCDGSFDISSEVNAGTKIDCSLALNHIDRPELGNIPELIGILMTSHPDVNIIFEHVFDSHTFSVSSKEIAEALNVKQLSDLSIKPIIEEFISNNITNE